MNIWQIISRLDNEVDFTYSELLDINESYDRARLRTLISRRMDGAAELRTCEASGWVFPHYQSDNGVGHNDGDDFCAPWMTERNTVYNIAYDQYGDSGWCHCDSTIWVEGENQYITNENYSRNYSRCPNCNEVFHDESYDRVYSERNDATYCCHECCENDDGYYDYDEDEDDEDDEDSSSSNPIHSYGTRIEHILPMNLESGKRYFGLEVEQEFPGERPAHRTGWANDNIDGLSSVTIWKSDGSLSNGAELVTLPKPLSYWQGDNPVKALCESKEHRKYARAHDTTTCGLHVHVSRSSIPEPVIAKVIYLMNEPCMRELTTLVARRSPSTTYCVATKKRWHSHVNDVPRTFYDWNKREDVKVHPWNRARPATAIQKRQEEQSGRYTPVNLTRNTIEFRIFRGTLKWSTLQASIEFCEAVICFCTQMGPARLNDTDFTAWLKSSVTRKAYPALRDYLEARTVLPMRRKKPDNVTDVTVSEPEIEPEVVEAPPAMYGTVEPTPEGHDRSDEWENSAMASNGAFFVDGEHWQVGHIEIDARGWTDAVPVRHPDSHQIIHVPLHCGQTWFSPDRSTSLTVYESI